MSDVTPIDINIFDELMRRTEEAKQKMIDDLARVVSQPRTLDELLRSDKEEERRHAEHMSRLIAKYGAVVLYGVGVNYTDGI